jgi:anti-sigma factor RsiW
MSGWKERIMSDQWTDRLSAYLDGELDDAVRTDLETHLAACAECVATLADLRRVVARATALEDRPPAADLWPGIADRLGRGTDQLALRRRRRHFTFTVSQLAAASLALVALSAALVWLALRGAPRSIAGNGPVPVAAPGVPPVQAVRWMPKVEESADAAVAELRTALAEGRRSGRLDSTTVAKLEHSLAVIDTAIAEAKLALDADPGSVYLNHHLAETYRRKLSFLRQAARIAAPRT